MRIKQAHKVYKLVIVDGKEMDLVVDLSETGLEMFFKPYQIASLDLLWNSDEHLSSREVWEKVNEVLPGTISRASIINFLNASVDNGLLDYVETTGKGGYRRLYASKLSKTETSKYLTEIVAQRLGTL
jgi:Fe2+ or Zn2+ uptake regulation protein